MVDKRSLASRPDLTQVLVEVSPAALIALSLEGEVLSWNNAAQTMFGYTSAEAVGRSIYDLVIPADRVVETRESMTTVLESGSCAYESVRRAKDGSPVLVDVSTRVVCNADGVAEFVVVATKDVTAMRSLHEAARVQARFPGLLASVPDAIVVINAMGRIVLVNGQTETLFGYTRDQLIGQTIELLVPERFRGSHVAHRSEYFADPRTRSMGVGLELYGRRRDGGEFPSGDQPEPAGDRGRDAGDERHPRHQRAEARRGRAPQPAGVRPRRHRDRQRPRPYRAGQRACSSSRTTPTTAPGSCGR